MTRDAKKEEERRVLNFFLAKVKKYKQYRFVKSEQPDFIDLGNNCGIEITDFHNFEIKRQIEVKIIDSLDKAKEKFSKNCSILINVYLHFNFNFLKSLESAKNKYFENRFSYDLASLCHKLVGTERVEISSRDIRHFNSNLSRVLTHVSIEPVEECDYYHGWDMICTTDASIDEKAVKAIIDKKEKLLNQYKKNYSQIRAFVLVINTNSSPVIGLKNKGRLYSTTGSLKYINDIKHIKSLFDEVYLVDIDQNKVVSNV